MSGWIADMAGRPPPCQSPPGLGPATRARHVVLGRVCDQEEGAQSLAGTAISRTYGPIMSLAAADYSTGEYFHYTYDAAGNGLTEVTQGGTTAYTNDIADRLATLGGATYT